MTDSVDNLHPLLRDLPGTTIVDRYRVDKVLGVGGMGAVFRGRHLGLERDVAIKVLHPDLTRDPEISKRFDREAHSASRLDHPNCLRVTDVGSTDDGIKFMVMDLLAGEELAERLGEPIEPERAVLMMLQVLRGLEHAHEKGVVHRDIKPENIFVTRDHEGREVLKLVDFGIAKLVGSGKDDRMTKAGLIFGTPAYMSPEQAMGMEADARADLYSVGVILYEMVSGEPPFMSDDPVKLVRMQVSKEPPPLPDTIAPALATVIYVLLAKDRDERFQSATQAREALELVLPAVASSEVISGATMHGSSVTGPIMINPAISGPIALGGPNDPISVPFPRIHLPSGSFSPSALPTLPPRSDALRARRSSRMPIIIGGALALVAGIWVVTRDGDEISARPEGTPAVAAAESAASIRGEEGGDVDIEEELLSVEDGPDEARLAEVDRLIFANKVGEAQKVLQPLLDEYPKHPILSWRQGRIFAQTKKKKSKALVAYGDALDAEPKLIDNHDFYAELHALLAEKSLRAEALDFVLRKMGRSGHKLLLQMVNDERSPMGYNDRRRALTELSTVDENDPLVNWQLHRALDLLQATEAITPCTAYRDALESIAYSPDYWYLARVERATVPKPKTGTELSEEDIADAAACEGIEERRQQVIVELMELSPEGGSGGEIVIEDDDGGTTDGAAKPAKAPSKGTASKSSGSKSGSKSTSASKSSGCNTPFGIFKKKCQ